MDSRPIPPLRSLPRCFVVGATAEAEIDLPKSEVDKLRKVLRLAEGDLIGVLPNDGSLIVCEFRARKAWPISTQKPATEPDMKVTLAQALPKSDRIDGILRGCTEVGISHFLLFPSDRSVVRWDDAKRQDRLTRFNAIVMEACEQSFRTTLPTVEFATSLEAVLEQQPDAIVLSESESEFAHLPALNPDSKPTIVVGPEGGWSPSEMKMIGARGVTLGARVLRVDTAAVAAASLLLLQTTRR